MNARFFCTDLTCGRGFHSEEDLKTHMFRRHGQVVVEVPDVNEKQEEIKKRIFGSYTLADKPVRVQELTSELILDVSGQDSIDDVTELILRNQNLESFVSGDNIDLDEMVSLEYLCISHNVLNDIDGVSQLLGLRELNMNNNLIGSLSALESLAQLSKLFCANNQIKVVQSLKGLKQLTEVSIYNNKLFDLEQSLKVFNELPKLKVLEIDRNPCVLQTSNVRYKILYTLKLDFLDGEPVTDVDEQIVHNIFGERQAFIPRNLVGKLRANAQMQGTLERDILYQEIEELKENLIEVTVERDKLLEEKEKNKKEDVDSLKDENVRLRREVSSMYVLLDEINELRSKMKEGLGSVASDIYEENNRLRARVIELEKKQKNEGEFRRPYTSAGIRPATASVKEAESDEIYEYIERNNQMLRNLENKVTAYKQDLKKIGK